jgi:hypothetical protein
MWILWQFSSNPDKEEIREAKEILEVFGSVSGLVTITEKSAVYPRD